MVALGRASVRDAVAVLLLVLSMTVSRRYFWLRGVTYRDSVLPLWQERLWKSAFYAGLLGLADAALRRGGQLLAQLGAAGPAGVLALSERSAGLLRVLFLHAPFVLWALRGPLSPSRSTRDDRGWSDAATRSWIWRFASARLFKHTRVVLSEEWRDLSPAERSRWFDRHYVIAMHPHGSLPFGAIICGLTWAGGGLRGVTASGAELPEPANPGKLLHQRWFRQMKLRAAVASGAAGLFPIFYEMFTTLGAFECTKDFMRDRLREGKDVAVFPGGAQESAYAHPGRYVCLISSRRGFVRLALEEQRDILPMWTFGDESIMPQMISPPKFLVALQQWFKECLGLLVPPMPSALPRFPPLTLVTGVPVSLEDLWAATPGGPVPDSAVEEAHRRYVAAQVRLFDRNKALVPGGHADAVLEIR